MTTTDSTQPRFTMLVDDDTMEGLTLAECLDGNDGMDAATIDKIRALEIGATYAEDGGAFGSEWSITRTA